MPTVVTPQHDDRVLVEAGRFECIDHAAELGVHVTHGRMIAVDQRALGCPRSTRPFPACRSIAEARPNWLVRMAERLLVGRFNSGSVNFAGS